MSNIIKRPESILSISENELVEALKETRFVDQSPERIRTEAVRIFKESCSRVGQLEVDEGILSVAVDDMVYSFQHELKQMTLGEVAIAIRSQSKVKESYSINSRVIFGWINTWRQTNKLQLQKQIAIKASRTKPEVHPELTSQQKIDNVTQQFKRYLEGAKVLTFIYPYLDEFEANLDTKNRFEILDEAIRELESETREAQGGLIARFRKQRLEELKAAKTDPSKSPEYVINRAKELTIKRIFENWKEFEQTPEQMLKQ